MPSQWSDGTKKEYAKKLKKSFKQRVKELQLEEEMKDLFKRDQGQEKPSPVTERAVIGMISDFEVSDRKMIKILRRMRELFGRNAVILLNLIPTTIMWTSLQRSTDRLYCRVLPTSTVTTCSFNPVVTIITMFPSNVGEMLVYDF